jgi:hypothetical protein
MSTSLALKSFYRSAWRESIKCKDYSTKYFIRRKLRERFRTTPETTKEFVPSVAGKELEQITRVVKMSNLYATEVSVLEKMK